ncbi:SAM-dependent methyltransferase [Mycolicibacter minnesotensis]|uniref:SAM-dependent methyltransferase n=1 Tax=Mycolicibacter minnesotensis TaxID=1118379 RepID=A0A7I7R6X3_9MYCO|nr:class I SAM-dependent methyltransferase [Mycolicibacter minnesotensis]ORA99558.1 SAM-dependent methyltransferase [Mycolicibacter minnesotensis]BBY34409.1 cyclopropane-fatty-acyl-phospholipid synthase [Mycolicibacter minnesotensis]
MSTASDLRPAVLVDPNRWPQLAHVPSGPLAGASAAVVHALLRRTAGRLPVRLVYPGGESYGARDPHAPELVIRDPDRMARRIGRSGLIGFGEAYMAGEWDSPDVVALLSVLAGSMGELVPAVLQRLRPLVLARQPRSRNTVTRARRNVSAHYDLSNELFALFLDETMTYSSALFDQLPGSWENLAQAQHRKIDRLLDMAAVGPRTRVLEIGTGWGELCLRAAARGASVRSLTLSREQELLARQRVAAAGLADRVEIELRDYREVTGSYDAVVSVEMIEAVGYRDWPGYFRTLERLTAPGGRVAIQAITMPHDRMMASRNTLTWIQKYIFPGGMLPSTQAIMDITGYHTGLRTVDMRSLGPHYADTLQLWRERFQRNSAAVAALGFDEVFSRMWNLYLAYSEAGFRSGYLDVYQWTFAASDQRQQ